MKALTLEEFAQDMRRGGDIRQADMADEILALIDIEEDCAEPYSDLCADIAHYAKEFSNPDDAAKALEWIGDRSDLLKEIEDALTENGREPEGTDNAADTVKHLLKDMREIEEILEGEGRDGAGDIAEALRHTLANWPPKLEYDL